MSQNVTDISNSGETHFDTPKTPRQGMAARESVEIPSPLGAPARLSVPMAWASTDSKRFSAVQAKIANHLFKNPTDSWTCLSIYLFMGILDDLDVSMLMHYSI